MKDDISKTVSAINLILELADEQVRRRQMEEKSEKNRKESEDFQTDQCNTN